jgi:CubicO group peptidase (beta-lactamase class C family)
MRSLCDLVRRSQRTSRLAFSLLLAMAPHLVRAQTASSDQVAAALPALDALAQQQVETGAVPGLAIAIVHDDEVVYLKGFGRREAGKPELVDGDTVFQIASLTKPISATVVAALVSDGKLAWDSRIADLDPAFQLYDAYPTAQLTLRDLFSHRSGLPGGAGDELEYIGFGRDEILRRLRLVPPSSSFRAGYSYSNFGLFVLRARLERRVRPAWPELGPCRRLQRRRAQFGHALSQSQSWHRRLDQRFSDRRARRSRR